MTPRLGSIQLQTFAVVDAHYSATSARCICGSTLVLLTDGEWVHGFTRSAWCALDVAR